MSVVAPDRCPASSVSWRSVVLLLAAGVMGALTETQVPTIIGRVTPLIDAGHLVIGFLIVGIALAVANQFWRLPWRQPGLAIVLAFFGSLIAGWLGGVSWPNSGDEYSYVYLTDTLLAGRLWNPEPPDPVLFDNFHVLVMNGRTFSPYPVAWSALLVPFRVLGAVWLANPLLTALLGTALMGAFRQLDVSPIVQKPALALVLLTPFTLFLGGSLFPQTMASALTACIVWAQLSDEVQPRRWRKLLIGTLFGVLLLTRYDVFAIVAVVYAIDRVVIRRFNVVADGLLVSAGWLPFVACQFAYNFGVTGDPLQLAANWGTAAIPSVPAEYAGTSVVTFTTLKDLFWSGTLAQFGGFPVLVLAMIALTMKIRRRTCRFYDFLLPVTMIFFTFVPFTGSHQYGPRYWFSTWPVAILTIASGVVDEAGHLHIRGLRVAFDGFVTACLVCAGAAGCILLVTTHIYIAARRVVYDWPQPQVPAVVLLPSRLLKIWPQQVTPIFAWSRDFTRNAIDYDAPVIFGRADAPDAIARACRLDGRVIFRWEEPDSLVRVDCR